MIRAAVRVGCKKRCPVLPCDGRQPRVGLWHRRLHLRLQPGHRRGPRRRVEGGPDRRRQGDGNPQSPAFHGLGAKRRHFAAVRPYPGFRVAASSDEDEESAGEESQDTPPNTQQETDDDPFGSAPSRANPNSPRPDSQPKASATGLPTDARNRSIDSRLLPRKFARTPGKKSPNWVARRSPNSSLSRMPTPEPASWTTQSPSAT